MENNQYESVQALVRQLHAPSKNVARPHSNQEMSKDEEKKRRHSGTYSPPIFAVDKATRKRSLFDSAFRIPALTITAPNSPETPEDHRRFSFVNFRRHSHSAVRHTLDYLTAPLIRANELCWININQSIKCCSDSYFPTQKLPLQPSIGFGLIFLWCVADSM